MKIDVSTTPFSTRGSYIALSYFPDNFRYQNNPEGLFIRSIRGDSKNGYICRIVPVLGKTKIEYTIKASAYELVLSTVHGDICLCFANSKTLLIMSTNENLGIILDCITGEYKYHYTHDIKCGNLLNCHSLSTKYVLSIIYGKKIVEQKWNRVMADTCEIYIQPHNGLLAYIEETYDESTFVKKEYDYDMVKSERQKQFEDFYHSMPSVPAEYENERELASYVNWSSIVDKSGLFKREAMLMSKNWMTNVWSWDHCFNALALSYNFPKEAYDQFIIMFDHQNKNGRIPDHLNDKLCTWNYCKPPIHGWAIHKIMEHVNFTPKKLTKIYKKLAKWTNWWLNYRISNNGVCEYYHGNDSGWDNSTVFKELPPVQTPDLSTFLAIQAQTLSEIAEKLNKKFEAKQWQRTCYELLKNMFNYLFENDLPVAKLSCNGKTVKSESLILYMPILLGEKLPEKYKNKIVEILKSDKFLTAFGLATESPQSEDYLPDGYWQGPIWAPSSMLIIDGLYAVGETEFAKDLSYKFCELIKKGGFAENFDAITGDGLRDRAYTWTSSVFLTLANKLNEEN